MEDEIKTQVELIKDLSDQIADTAERNEAAAESAAKETVAEPVNAEMVSKPADEKPAKAPKEKKPFTQWPVFGWFLNSRNAGALVLKCILLFPVIPYAYLFILSAIFSSLNVYEAVGFILYSSLAFAVINIGLIVWAIVRFTKVRRV